MKADANKRMQTAVVTALIVSALIVAAACALPAFCMGSLNGECLPLLESAREAAIAGDFGTAHELLARAAKIEEAHLPHLKLYFDHNSTAALDLSVRTACDLAIIGEASQLIAEIDSAIGSLRFLNGVTQSGPGELL